VEVDWHRSRLEIQTETGLVPNTTYTLTQLRGVSDLRGKRDSTEHRYIFTTGPTRAPALIRGIVFDWVAARPAPRAVRRGGASARQSDVWRTIGFDWPLRVSLHAPGKYLLRAVIDANTNRVIDRRELFDSATVTLGDSISREMLAFVHDSIGAGIATVEVKDSLTLRATFDRPLQSGVAVPPSRFSLKAADSTVVPLASVSLGSVYEREERDSARRQGRPRLRSAGADRGFHSSRQPSARTAADTAAGTSAAAPPRRPAGPRAIRPHRHARPPRSRRRTRSFG
jgi:hypothetical protein